MNRDNRSNLVPILILNDAISSNTNTDSSGIDVADYDGGIKFNVFASAYTDGSYAVEIHAGDTSTFTISSSTKLSGDELIPSSGTITLTAALAKGGTIEALGVLSIKRYIKVRIVSTSVTTGATIVCTAEAVPEIKPRS